MPVPFRPIVKRPALRRILVPFTLALAFVGLTAFVLAGA